MLTSNFQKCEKGLYIPLINRVRGPYRKLRTEYFSILLAQAPNARAMRKKQGPVTYGTDRANEVIRCLLYGFSFSFYEVFSLTRVARVGWVSDQPIRIKVRAQFSILSCGT